MTSIYILRQIASSSRYPWSCGIPGTPIFVMDLTIDEQRSLARADPLTVLSALEENGFYLNFRRSFMRGGKNK